MIELLIAVFASSLLGSVHCVGMCGPFALLATRSEGVLRASVPGGRDSTLVHMRKVGWLSSILRQSAYHIGRLTTYLVLGAFMGGLASAGNGFGDHLGIGQWVAKVVGITMIFLGVIRVKKLLKGGDGAVRHSKFFEGWNRLLIALRKSVPQFGAIGNAYTWGLLSTWLPCGWLYVFALASASAGGAFQSMAMMFAFWLGTLPWLGLVSQGSQWLQRIHPQAFQWMAALMLIGFGFWTWASRSEVDLRGLERVNMTRGTGTTVEDVEAIRETPLPCCSKESE